MITGIPGLFSNGSLKRDMDLLTIEDFDFRFDEHVETHLLESNNILIFTPTLPPQYLVSTTVFGTHVVCASVRA